MQRVRRLLSWLTVEQYAKIDAEYRTQTTLDSKALWTLLAVTLALVLPRYFGRPSHIAGVAAAHAWFATLPYPEIYPHLYWSLFKLVNYLLLPALVIKLAYKERLVDFGLRATSDRRVLSLYVAMFLVVLPLVWLVSYSPEFLARYPKYDHAGRSIAELLAWEAAYGLQFLLLEFFFRGFALIAMARYFGHAAIFIMVIPYTMIHFAKALPETLGAIITGIALGTLALRTRSIYGGVVLHCAIAWSMDGLALWQKGELGKLLGR